MSAPNVRETEDGRGLTLYEIEQGLGAMMDARDEAQTDEERAACEAIILAYVSEEVRKVDNIRAYIRNAEIAVEAAQEEAQRQMARAHAWKKKIMRLKDFIAMVMHAGQLKKLEGRTGTILLKGNGGMQPLTVDEEFLPDQYCEYTVRMTSAHYKFLEPVLAGVTIGVSRTPNNAAIRAALASSQDVPGARLEERGTHVEVK